MIPWPEFSVPGYVVFMGLGLGITIGDALFAVPMKQLEQGISRRS